MLLVDIGMIPFSHCRVLTLNVLDHLSIGYGLRGNHLEPPDDCCWFDCAPRKEGVVEQKATAMIDRGAVSLPTTLHY